MKKVEWFCDHCGKRIDARNGYLEQDIGFETPIVTDLCCECIDKLEEMMGAFCSNCKQKDGADND